MPPAPIQRGWGGVGNWAHIIEHFFMQKKTRFRGLFYQAHFFFRNDSTGLVLFDFLSVSSSFKR